MVYRLLPLLLLGLVAATGDFSTPSARHAREVYEIDLNAAAKKYTTALTKAQQIAFRKKDLAEANLLEDELNRVKRGDGPRAAVPAFVGRTFQSPDGRALSCKPDGTFGNDAAAADDQPVQRWFALADDRALVYSSTGETTLFVFVDGFAKVESYEIGRQAAQPAWAAPAQPPAVAEPGAPKRWPLGHR